MFVSDINMLTSRSRALERFQNLSKKQLSYSPPSPNSFPFLPDTRDADDLGCSSLLTPSSPLATPAVSTGAVISKRKLFDAVSFPDNIISPDVRSSRI